MTKYTIKRFNPVGKFWSDYDSTYCMVDAYAILQALQSMGFTASITSEHVSKDD